MNQSKKTKSEPISTRFLTVPCSLLMLFTCFSLKFDDNRAVTGKYERLHSSFLAQDHRDKSMNHKFHFQKKRNAMNHRDKDLFKELFA